jgi:hypothetical protein
MTIITNTHYNFDKAENNVFAWNYWDGTSGGELLHKPTGRRIYQMYWLDGQGKMAEKVTGEIRDQAVAFWNELHALQENPDLYTGAEAAQIENLDFAASEPKHGENGYCRKCHSYCWGDCEAN